MFLILLPPESLVWVVPEVRGYGMHDDFLSLICLFFDKVRDSRNDANL